MDLTRRTERVSLGMTPTTHEEPSSLKTGVGSGSEFGCYEDVLTGQVLRTGNLVLRVGD